MKGRPKTDMKDEAKICAELMGYHWTDNTDPSMRFDSLMYRSSRMADITVLEGVTSKNPDGCFS